VTDDRDAAVRLRAFEFLRELRQRLGEASIPRSILERGFDLEGVRVPLIGPQGIFKPAILPEVPLTITTTAPVEHRDRPYDDGFVPGGFLRYRRSPEAEPRLPRGALRPVPEGGLIATGCQLYRNVHN
jgi:putative restriction endonuclease